MLISNEIQEERELRERIAELETELAAAHARIAQQQQKLKLLVERVKVSRPPSLCDIDLASPAHPYREMAANKGVNVGQAPERVEILRSSGAARVAALWETRPAWVLGGLSGHDAAFLDAIIERVQPDEVHEVGTASGTSSALILDSMAVNCPAAPTWLYSYDITPDCYFDASRKVGDATRQMVPSLLQRWNLNTSATALDVRPTSARPLYFIDANHIHPWPTFDLIALLTSLRPGDTVVLHDINLFAISKGKFQDIGAQWLFQEWLGPRLVPDVEIPNIGAIVIPDDIRLVLPSLMKSLLHPWVQSRQPNASLMQRYELRLSEFLGRNRVTAL